ncbi:DUF1697 domain-containing protein, partial [Streptomyces albogriseolus]|uniref:DUF1697 domain-containing protein n=1 Tax=Streptomyces albogriseolus TaxID=1887 RepID=UPI003676BCDD
MATRYAALLRGINVGGGKKVPMAELRGLLESLGLRDVRTYLQSGQAAFTAGHGGEESLAADLSGARPRPASEARERVLPRPPHSIRRRPAPAP